MAESDPSTPEFLAANYCISFIDLLGQREAVRGQGLLPIIKTEADDAAFHSILRDIIRPILQLQRDAEVMAGAAVANSDSPFRMSLTEEKRALWDELVKKRVKTQHWSDGIIRFICLGSQEIVCPLNGIFEIFCLSGSHCFFGLARRRPVRGAIDIAWGVELCPGELYGPVVASAYEIESEVAQYPRIVVGHRVVAFLEVYRANTSQDLSSRVNHEIAELCLNMLVQDVDGHWIIHYLGDTFKWAMTQANHNDLYEKARSFAIEQLEASRKSFNGKLAFRYSHLINYFDAHSAPT